MKGKTRRWQYNWSHWGHLAPISDFLIIWKSKCFIPPPSFVWVILSQISSTCYWKTFSPFFCAFNSIFRAFLQVPNLSSTVTDQLQRYGRHQCTVLWEHGSNAECPRVVPPSTRPHTSWVHQIGYWFRILPHALWWILIGSALENLSIFQHRGLYKFKGQPDINVASSKPLGSTSQISSSETGFSLQKQIDLGSFATTIEKWIVDHILSGMKYSLLFKYHIFLKSTISTIFMHFDKHTYQHGGEVCVIDIHIHIYINIYIHIYIYSSVSLSCSKLSRDHMCNKPLMINYYVLTQGARKTNISETSPHSWFILNTFCPLFRSHILHAYFFFSLWYPLIPRVHLSTSFQNFTINVVISDLFIVEMVFSLFF